MGDNGTQRIEDKSPVNGAIHRVGKSPSITTNATTNAIGGIRRTAKTYLQCAKIPEKIPYKIPAKIPDKIPDKLARSRA